jgi:hypothetical protein
MRHSNEIEQELSELTPGMVWPGREMPFHVPAGYFDNLPARISEDALLSLNKPIDVPYEVPAGYFDQLSAQVIHRALSETTTEQNNSSNNSSQEGSSGKIISLFFRKAMPYAAAALLGGILVTGAFLFTDQRAGINRESFSVGNLTASHTILSPDNELYKDISFKMQSLSDDEINRYLEENTSTETVEWQPEEIN